MGPALSNAAATFLRENGSAPVLRCAEIRALAAGVVH